MLRVRDIMTPNVVTIAVDRTLREAIDALVTCKIGGMPVLDGDHVAGVLSAADILEFESVTPTARRQRESDEEPTPLEDREVWDEQDDAPSSYFTDLWDDGPDVVERIATAEGPEWDFLSQHTVEEAMSRALCTVPETMEVSAAAQRMLASGVQRALVLAGDTFTGILTTTDILRAVAEHRLSVRENFSPEKAKI